jgi:hypothetical protein
LPRNILQAAGRLPQLLRHDLGVMVKVLFQAVINSAAEESREKLITALCEHHGKTLGEHQEVAHVTTEFSSKLNIAVLEHLTGPLPGHMARVTNNEQFGILVNEVLEYLSRRERGEKAEPFPTYLQTLAQKLKQEYNTIKPEHWQRAIEKFGKLNEMVQKRLLGKKFRDYYFNPFATLTMVFEFSKLKASGNP